MAIYVIRYDIVRVHIRVCGWVYGVQCMPYSVRRKVYTVRLGVWLGVRRTVYTVYTVRPGLWLGVRRTLYAVQCTLYGWVCGWVVRRTGDWVFRYYNVCM